eukprot:4834920-Pyramimonas_sp.AAC.2
MFVTRRCILSRPPVSLRHVVVHALRRTRRMAPKTTTPCRDGWRSPDRWRCRRSRAETGGAADDAA